MTLDTMPPTRTRSLVALFVFLASSAAAGAIGRLLQGSYVQDRYLSFNLPSWAPPPAAFGIVWPILYVLIAVAAWWLWRGVASPEQRRVPLVLWGAQLAVNAVWPGVFFGVNEFAWALLVIVVLDVLVLATVVSFLRDNRVAGVMLVPYLVWLLYATALNAALLWLN